MARSPAVLRFLSGPSEGISTSLVLHVDDGEGTTRSKGMYIFGVGEGLSRVFLEHKVRPDASLKATFCGTVNAGDAGGHGGMLMRLRHDGHGQVTCVGPGGLGGQLKALHHVMSWRHPAVSVAEFSDLDNGEVAFEDERIAVYALTNPAYDWQPPAALQSSQRSPVEQTFAVTVGQPSPGAGSQPEAGPWWKRRADEAAVASGNESPASARDVSDTNSEAPLICERPIATLPSSTLSAGVRAAPFAGVAAATVNASARTPGLTPVASLPTRPGASAHAASAAAPLPSSAAVTPMTGSAAAAAQPLAAAVPLTMTEKRRAKRQRKARRKKLVTGGADSASASGAPKASIGAGPLGATCGGAVQRDDEQRSSLRAHGAASGDAATPGTSPLPARAASNASPASTGVRHSAVGLPWAASPASAARSAQPSPVALTGQLAALRVPPEARAFLASHLASHKSTGTPQRAAAAPASVTALRVTAAPGLQAPVAAAALAAAPTLPPTLAPPLVDAAAGPPAVQMLGSLPRVPYVPPAAAPVGPSQGARWVVTAQAAAEAAPLSAVAACVDLCASTDSPAASAEAAGGAAVDAPTTHASGATPDAAGVACDGKLLITSASGEPTAPQVHEQSVDSLLRPSRGAEAVQSGGVEAPQPGLASADGRPQATQPSGTAAVRPPPRAAAPPSVLAPVSLQSVAVDRAASAGRRAVGPLDPLCILEHAPSPQAQQSEPRQPEAPTPDVFQHAGSSCFAAPAFLGRPQAAAAGQRLAAPGEPVAGKETSAVAEPGHVDARASAAPIPPDGPQPTASGGGHGGVSGSAAALSHHPPGEVQDGTRTASESGCTAALTDSAGTDGRREGVDGAAWLPCRIRGGAASKRARDASGGDEHEYGRHAPRLRTAAPQHGAGKEAAPRAAAGRPELAGERSDGAIVSDATAPGGAAASRLDGSDPGMEEGEVAGLSNGAGPSAAAFWGPHFGVGNGSSGAVAGSLHIASEARDAEDSMESDEDDDEDDDEEEDDDDDDPTTTPDGSMYDRLDLLLTGRADRASIFDAIRSNLAAPGRPRLPVSRLRKGAPSAPQPPAKRPAGAPPADERASAASGDYETELFLDSLSTKTAGNPVTMTRAVGGGINKVSKGAPAFLVRLKRLNKWVLICCASEVEHVGRLAEHPVLPLLCAMAPPSQPADRSGGAAPLGPGDGGALVCVHAGPPAILKSFAYRRLLERLPECMHVCADEGSVGSRGFALCASGRQIARLALIDPDLFPLPHHLQPGPPLRDVLLEVATRLRPDARGPPERPTLEAAAATSGAAQFRGDAGACIGDVVARSGASHQGGHAENAALDAVRRDAHGLDDGAAEDARRRADGAQGARGAAVDAAGAASRDGGGAMDAAELHAARVLEARFVREVEGARKKLAAVEAAHQAAVAADLGSAADAVEQALEEARRNVEASLAKLANVRDLFGLSATSDVGPKPTDAPAAARSAPGPSNSAETPIERALRSAASIVAAATGPPAPCPPAGGRFVAVGLLCHLDLRTLLFAGEHLALSHWPCGAPSQSQGDAAQATPARNDPALTPSQVEGMELDVRKAQVTKLLHHAPLAALLHRLRAAVSQLRRHHAQAQPPPHNLLPPLGPPHSGGHLAAPPHAYPPHAPLQPISLAPPLPGAGQQYQLLLHHHPRPTAPPSQLLPQPGLVQAGLHVLAGAPLHAHAAPRWRVDASGAVMIAGQPQHPRPHILLPYHAPHPLAAAPHAPPPLFAYGPQHIVPILPGQPTARPPPFGLLQHAAAPPTAPPGLAAAAAPQLYAGYPAPVQHGLAPQLASAPPTRDEAEICIDDVDDDACDANALDEVAAALPPPDEQLWRQIQPVATPEAPQHAELVHRSRGWASTSLLFLGTGSAEPSKYRGPSATLLQVDGAPNAHVMMDCGEATWPALVRSVGLQQAQRIVEELAAIWISHSHCDHCLGLHALLERRPPRLAPVLLVVPRSVQKWIEEGYPHLVQRARFVHCSDFSDAATRQRLDAWTQDRGGAGGAHSRGGGPTRAPDQGGRGLGPRGGRNGRDRCDTALQPMLAAGYTEWRCVRARHSPDSWCLVLRHREGWKLVNSGDTKPVPELAREGHGATVLIHEATYANALAAKAADNSHSTVGQALEAGDRMDAWRVIVTHFSQRYSRHMPDIEAEGCSQERGLLPARRRASAAFDGMRVRLSQLPVLPSLTPALVAFMGEAACDAAE